MPETVEGSATPGNEFIFNLQIVCNIFYLTSNLSFNFPQGLQELLFLQGRQQQEWKL
jgi:hypothetical protein